MQDMSMDSDTCRPNMNQAGEMTVAQAIALLRNPHLSSGQVLEEPPHKRRLLEGQHEDKDNKIQQFPSLDNDVFDRPVQLKDIDVLSGRGGHVKNHPGNLRFWRVLAPFRHEYQSAAQRDFAKKQDIANQVYALVREGGTRFIKRNQESDLLEEQSEAECLDKIKHGLRNVHIPAFLVADPEPSGEGSSVMSESSSEDDEMEQPQPLRDYGRFYQPVFRVDEERDRLWDIPEDLPGQPGMEWLTSSAIVRRMSPQGTANPWPYT